MPASATVLNVIDSTTVEDRLARLERQVSEAWEEVLGERDIPHDTDYWELGHGAMRAMRILEIIRSKTGVELPISVLYEASTIQRLARAVLAEAKVPFSRLVLLKSGSSEKPPLFIVSGIGAIVLELFPTARAMTYSGPVYALQPRGLNDGERPHESCEEMAAHYVEVIRQVQPSGPYFLSGYSIGGYVAIEMARLLEAENEQVPFLGLLDSHPFEAVWPFHIWLGFMLQYPLATIWRTITGSLKAREQRSKRPAREVAEISSNSSSAPLDSARWTSAPLSRQSRMRWILHSLQRFTIRYLNPRNPSFARRTSYYTSGLPPNLQRTFENGLVLVAEYRPQYWDKEMVLFKSRLGDHAQCDPMKVWPKYFPRLEVRLVPGNHRNMLHGTNAVALAKEVSDILSTLSPA